MTTRIATVTMTVAPFASGISVSVSRNFSTVPPVWPPGTPSIPATCPIATWIPTPVRNPIKTLEDRKSARNPRRTSLARKRIAAVSIATIPASETQSAEAGAARPVRPAARIAAVAESAPTTKCRDDPSSAKIAIGIKIVYSPVITGIWAIVA